MPNMSAEETRPPQAVAAAGRGGPPLVQGARRAALACAFALIALAIAGELIWARVGHGTLVLKALPLVAALPGLSRHRLQTYRWLSLVSWVYAAEGALRLRDPAPAGAFAIAELALSIALFAACATAVRVRLAQAPLALPPADSTAHG